MRALLLALLLVVLTSPAVACPGEAWGRPHDPARHQGRAPPSGPDANRDGRVSSFEKVQTARAERWARHGLGAGGDASGSGSGPRR